MAFDVFERHFKLAKGSRDVVVELVGLGEQLLAAARAPEGMASGPLGSSSPMRGRHAPPSDGPQPVVSPMDVDGGSTPVTGGAAMGKHSSLHNRIKQNSGIVPSFSMHTTRIARKTSLNVRRRSIHRTITTHVSLV